MPPSNSPRKKRRSSSLDDGFSLKSVETLFSKQLMRVLGILFLGASLWFAANSADTIFKVAKNLMSPRELIVRQNTQLPSPGSQELPTGNQLPDRPESSTPPVTFPMVLIVAAAMAGWLMLQLITQWKKRAEFQIISVFLFFTALIAMIRSFSWQTELFFPLLILVSAGLFFFGRHLSHTGTRIDYVFTWSLFSLWWLLKVMIGSQRVELPTFFIFSSLIFLTFHLILLANGFAGHRVSSKYFELLAIFSNAGFYFILVAATLLKFYGKPTLFFLVLALSAFYVLTLLAMDYLGKPYRKMPFLIIVIVLFSLLLPFLFWKSALILFAGSLSMLLLLFSKQSNDQPSIIIGLGLIVVMALVFSKELLFSYIPAAFMGGLMDNSALFYKGLVSSLFITLAAFVDRLLLKDLDINYSRKWFSRRRYRMLLRGVFLAGLYFALFWIWQYAWITYTGFEEVALISWFSFHCLFFIIAIPWLASERSSFLPVAVMAAVIFTVLYPSLLALQNINLLAQYLHHVPSGITVFPLHYLPSLLFLGLIAVVMQFAGKAFKGNNLAKRLFLIYGVAMVLAIVVSELVFTGVAYWDSSQSEDISVFKAWLGLPSSIALFSVGVILLAWGFIRQKRFGRTLAMILLFLVAFKLIYVDLKSISLLTRVILLFTAGTVFIGLSLGYTKATKAFRSKRKHVSRPHAARQAGLQPTHSKPPQS